MKIPAFYCPIDVEDPEFEWVLSVDVERVRAALAKAMAEDGVPPSAIATLRVLSCEAEDRDDTIVEAEGNQAILTWVANNASFVDED